jgi:hypothetical protein
VPAVGGARRGLLGCVAFFRLPLERMAGMFARSGARVRQEALANLRMSGAVCGVCISGGWFGGRTLLSCAMRNGSPAVRRVLKAGSHPGLPSECGPALPSFPHWGRFGDSALSEECLFWAQRPASMCSNDFRVHLCRTPGCCGRVTFAAWIVLPALFNAEALRKRVMP